MDRPILVTGGAGFIGSNFILHQLKEPDCTIVNLDKLTYAGNLANLAAVQHDTRYSFIEGDICDANVLEAIFKRYQPRAVVHFAAESHVDRSIRGADDFVRTNVLGTVRLLQVARRYWGELDDAFRSFFRFLHVSTDEVFGSLNRDDEPFHEETRYDPRSPYSASKAAADHFVRAWSHTYGFPVLLTNCSNNYGPYQFPEKLIPLSVLTALRGEKIPLYGDGLQIRDWLHVEDHCRALSIVLRCGQPGETYNIGGDSEKTNHEVATRICRILDEIAPLSDGSTRDDCIKFVGDRPGHDRRYAVNSSKIKQELSWRPQQSFEDGLKSTIRWYLANPEWIASIQTGAYRDWITTQYEGAAE